MFFHAEVDYLDHVIKTGALEIAPVIVKAVQEDTPPCTVRRVWSFILPCNDNRGFVKGFSRIATPLNDLMCKGEPQRWGTLEPRLKKTSMH